MLVDALIKLFKRDLNKLKAEIELYETESNLWILDKNILNTAGNLSLHIVGNLNHFIGAVLGETGYVRKRNLEFSLRNIPREELLKQIDATIVVVETTLNNLPKARLEENYPIEVFKAPMTTTYFLMHLATHLTYHLGQINYHRRLLD